jgi:hypothetical protein
MKFKSCDIFIDQKFYVGLKNFNFMGSDIQPGVIRAQKLGIQINRVTYLMIKNTIPIGIKYTFMGFKWNWKFFFLH